ncbi:MAG: DUF2092 domain-containing protein [Verrucomicrobiota bacterium]
MIKHTLLAISLALFASSCASRYTALPADHGVPPDADALLKSMSTRLASSSNYRFTATRTMEKERAEKMHQPAKAGVEVVVAKPDKLAVKVTGKGAPSEMIFDGRTFTVVDGLNRFYSKAQLRGTLDKVPGHLAQVYGFQPPLAEFIVSDVYQDIKGRVESVSYLGRGTVNEGGKSVQCQRIGLQGGLADAELWLAVSDSLPRRLIITAKPAAGSGTIMDVDFLTWDLNAPASDSTFRYQPPAGAEETPMISLSEAAAAQR